MNQNPSIFPQNPTRDILCAEEKPGACGAIIFGASGDLTQRKLLPSLFDLYRDDLLPDKFFILGYARSELDTAAFRNRIRNALSAADSEIIEKFTRMCHYQRGDYRDPEAYRKLATAIQKLDETNNTGGNLFFYISTPPQVYTDIVDRLGDADLLAESNTKGWRRLVLEKPFGHDLESARELDNRLHRVVKEHQVYRIDHYLGKETVQNIFMLRFANAVFEPIWNHRYIEHVQITAAESLGIGSRAGYYDRTGCLRDMFQNHMMQLLSLVGMEPPASFEADYVRDERLKLLRSVRGFDPDRIQRDLVRGQYACGSTDDGKVKAYRQEDKIAATSMTETFVAGRFWIDNWRWKGVPFYLRSGKRLAKRSTKIAVFFKRVPHSIFPAVSPNDLTQNVLVLKIQPDEGVALTLHAKRPGPKLCMSGLTMSFNYSDLFQTRQRDAYERLLLDVMLGDQTLFIRHDNIEMQWSILMPVLEVWQHHRDTAPEYADLSFYESGSWGPPAADRLLRRDNHSWMND